MPRSTPSSKRAVSFALTPRGCRTVGLRTENAPFEKCFDIAELFGDHGAELALMRRDLKRGIDEETAFAFSIIDRVVDYLGKEPMDCFLGRQRRL